jgi:hypothetical protein
MASQGARNESSGGTNGHDKLPGVIRGIHAEIAAAVARKKEHLTMWGPPVGE